MGEVHPGQRVHLELRRGVFILYTDQGKQRIELPYADADEVIEHLTRVLGSDEYLIAKKLPPERSADGHLLDDSPRKMRTVDGGNHKKMRIICNKCKQAITSPSARDLSKREFGIHLCENCYKLARDHIFPISPEGKLRRTDD